MKELAEIYFEGIVKVAIGESAGVAKKTGAGYGLCGIKGAWHAKGGRRVCRRFRGGCDDSEKIPVCRAFPSCGDSGRKRS